MISTVKDEEFTCDYYLSGIKDMCLRFAYEAFCFGETYKDNLICENGSINSIDAFLLEKISGLLAVWEEIPEAGFNLQGMSFEYSEALKLLTIEKAFIAAQQLQNRLDTIMFSPIKTKGGLSDEKEALLAGFRISMDINNLRDTVYKAMNKYSSFLDRAIYRFRDYTPDWGYHAAVTSYAVSKGVNRIVGCNNEILDKVRDLLNRNIIIHEVFTIPLLPFAIENKGKYVVFCGHHGKLIDPEQKRMDAIWYFSPLYLTDSLKEAKEKCVELQRPVNVITTKRYFPKVQYGQLSGEEGITIYRG